MSSPLGPEYEKAFTPDTVKILAGALQKAYATACELHDAARGGNAQTFGIGVYYYSVFEISKAAESSDGVITVVTENVLFRFNIGEYALGCYRAGSTGTEDIDVSFPNNHGAIREMVQVPLPGFESEFDLSTARKGVLIHMGNPEDGLCAIYFCIPTRIGDNGQISAWGHTELLWQSDAVKDRIAAGSTGEGGGASSPLVPSTLPLTPAAVVPEEKIEKAVVSRRSKQQDKKT